MINRIIGIKPLAVLLAAIMLPQLAGAQEINPLEKSAAELQDSLKAITVTADAVRKSTIFRITGYDLKTTVSPMGEADAIKYIQTLPGVTSGMEGSSAIYVRGGNVGNNLISVDGVPIYGSTHLLGMTSVFPTSMIGETEFYMGGFTSEDANFSASHIKLHSKEGDFHDTHAGLSVCKLA